MDNKYILKGITDKNETIYEITNEGRQAINLVQDLIPGFTRFQIDNNFKEDFIINDYSPKFIKRNILAGIALVVKSTLQKLSLKKITVFAQIIIALTNSCLKKTIFLA